jgi:hypothetical protein
MLSLVCELYTTPKAVCILESEDRNPLGAMMRICVVSSLCYHLKLEALSYADLHPTQLTVGMIKYCSNM